MKEILPPSFTAFGRAWFANMNDYNVPSWLPDTTQVRWLLWEELTSGVYLDKSTRAESVFYMLPGNQTIAGWYPVDETLVPPMILEPDGRRLSSEDFCFTAEDVALNIRW